MRPERPSQTAEMVCSWRALEALLAPERRILSDAYARAFLGPARARVLDLLERLPEPVLRAVGRRVDRALQGAMTFVLARHRAIDDGLAACGAEQVVLLGAGYDSRCVRLEPALRGATLFEVDHPATAARRAELAGRAFGAAPRLPVTSVAIDFQRESLEERLLQAGLRPELRTAWVWEGVSMYLDQAAVSATLGLVARLSPPGSRLWCDVWCPPAGGLWRLTHRDLPALAFKLIYDEPLTFGIERPGLEPLFLACGLRAAAVTPAPELVARYQPLRRSRFELGMVLVEAEVPPR